MPIRPVDPDQEKSIFKEERYGPKSKHKLTPQQIQALRGVLEKQNPEFLIVPSAEFRDLLVKQQHMFGMSEFIKAELISGKGIRIDYEMVLEWLDGKLDARNAFVLNNCEIMLEGMGSLFSLIPEGKVDNGKEIIIEKTDTEDN